VNSAQAERERLTALRSLRQLQAELEPIGRVSSGGYRRFAWTPADLQAREWFRSAATDRGLDVQSDRNGNLWAWWLPAGTTEPRDAFVTGSHLDSVPDGGAFDGPLGVVSALCAVDALRDRGIEPARPVAVVVFADEEGARFGVACGGSRLTTGALDPDRARGLRDRDGGTLAEAMRTAGHDPSQLGPDHESLARIGVFVELHVEQGRALVDLGAPVAIGTGIWPHGRWRYTFTGEANHAGTTRLVDRRDPMLAFAETVLRARSAASENGGVATFGRLDVEPNGTNAIPSRVSAWLDARAPEQASLQAIVDEIAAAAAREARDGGTACDVEAESVSPVVHFSAGVAKHLYGALGAIPELATGAGHDSGILSEKVPTGMLFVRNPTGISHAPAEFAEPDDCAAGVEALAAAMQAWVAS
jgi:N-carbamoyl-L-amino-acid hydrolase